MSGDIYRGGAEPVAQVATLTRYLDDGRYCDCKHDHGMRTCSHCRAWNAWKAIRAHPPTEPRAQKALREALGRIETGDCGDWTCDCPARDIARAALDPGSET